jgi:hypothetical protein
VQARSTCIRLLGQANLQSCSCNAQLDDVAAQAHYVLFASPISAEIAAPAIPIVSLHFGIEDEWYLYPHDELLEIILRETSIATTESWSERDGYSFAGLSKDLRKLLAPYRIAGSTGAIPK